VRSNDKLEIVQMASHSFRKFENGKSIPGTNLPKKNSSLYFAKQNNNNKESDENQKIWSW